MLEREVVAASLPLARRLFAASPGGGGDGATVADALRLVAVTAGTGQEEARVIGMIALTAGTTREDGPRQARIRALAVAANHRRRGVGARLLQAAERWARRNRMAALTTIVVDDNHAALAFFHRAGYYEKRGALVKPLAAAERPRTDP